MSRRRSEQPTDRWHRSTLAPGEQPCRGGDGCRGAKTAPTGEHGQGMRWLATWTEVVDGVRQPRRKSRPTYDEALYFQAAMRKGIQDKTMPPGTTARRGVTTVAGYFPAFMELTGTERSAGSNGKVRAQFAHQVEPYLGGRDMAELQHEPGALRRWQETLLATTSPRGTPYTYATVYEAFRLLGAMFRAALGDTSTGVVTNPFHHPQARLRKADRKRGRREGGWTAELISRAYLADPPQQIRGSAPAWSRYRTMLLLSGTTGGMRLSEAAALSPDDIDWARQLIAVNYTLARDFSGTLHFREGKSDAAQRVTTAAPLVLDALDSHRGRFAPAEVTLPLETEDMYGVPMADWPRITRTLLFSTGRGTPLSDPAYQSAARFGLSQAGLLPARPIESRSVRNTATGRYAPNGGHAAGPPRQPAVRAPVRPRHPLPRAAVLLAVADGAPGRPGFDHQGRGRAQAVGLTARRGQRRRPRAPGRRVRRHPRRLHPADRGNRAGTLAAAHPGHHHRGVRAVPAGRRGRHPHRLTIAGTARLDWQRANTPSLA